MNHFTTFDGLSIAFDVLGEGPEVLLHHGFASESHTNWVRPGLAAAMVGAGRRVVLIDARGHGQSDKPHEPEAYSGDAMVRDVLALLDHLGLASVDLVGYSMGAFVSIGVATLQPPEERLRSLVLGGAGSGQASIRSRELMLVIAEALEAPDRASVSDPTGQAFRNFAEATHADRLALAAIQRSRSSQPDMAALARICVPTLVVNGQKDTLVGPLESLAERISGARFAAVPGDHLSAVVQPEFRATLLGWLAEQVPATTA